MKAQIKNARLAFENTFTASSFDPSQQAKFSGTFIFEPGGEAEAIIRDAMTQVARDKWGDQADRVLKDLESKDRTCLHNGDDKPYNGFQGNMYVNASNKMRPLVLDEQRHPLTQQDGKIYNGVIVNALVDIWAQSSPQYGKRINATLLGVQFVKHAAPFSGGRAASVDDFEIVEDDVEMALA